MKKLGQKAIKIILKLAGCPEIFSILFFRILFIYLLFLMAFHSCVNK